MWARASSLHRHLECPAASHLPRDEKGEWVPGYLVDPRDAEIPDSDEYPNQGDSIFAEHGTQMHLAKENSPFASDPWLAEMNPFRERLWPSTLGRHEIPVSYNCRTRKVAEGPHDGADSWKGRQGPDCVTGTTDWVGSIPSGDLWIDDLKTGHAIPDPLSVQFKFYAMCFLKLRHQLGDIKDLNPRRIVRTSATHWPRGEYYDKVSNDPFTRYWAQLTWLDLEEFEEDLCRAWRITRKIRVPIPGTHCTYCPSLEVCEAINGVTRIKLKEQVLDE
jgi:hypothetical protein